MLVKPSGNTFSIQSGTLLARIYQQSGHIELVGPDLAGNPLGVTITFEPPKVTVPKGDVVLGRVLSSQMLGDVLELVQALGDSQVTTHLSFPHEGVMRFEVIDWEGLSPSKITITAASDQSEHFYGFGEKFDALDQAGKTVSILTFDHPGPKGDSSYKVAPWFVSTRGYGFHLDSSAESRFDMRASAADRIVVTHLFATLRFNVVYGPRLADVVSRYTGYTGRPALPPPFAFGPWISSDIWRSGGEVRYAATKFLEHGIPASMFVFDSPWEVAYNDFSFNLTQFGNGGTFEGVHYNGFSSVAEMMDFLRSNGLKVICWMTPFINKSSKNERVPGQNLGKAPNYDAGAAQNFFVRSSPMGPPLVVPWWKGSGSPIDFTNPDAAQWLSGQLQSLVTQSLVATGSGAKEPAIGGFKTDDGETGNGPNTYIPKTAVYADGRTGLEMQNGYCVEYHKTVSNVLGSNGILFARSGFTGTQAFPGCWAGDNEPNFGDGNGLPSVISAGLSAAMSGFSIWGHDIGGYQNVNFSPASPADLFMRWTQFGCFTPLMQMHRQVNPKDLRQYPWGYGPEALDNYRFFARLHTELFPYLYTYATESHTSGLPILRPLVLLHQEDPQTFGVRHAYQFGNEFLVAPVIQPTIDGQATQRSLYLPQGFWHDFWTQERHSGGQQITWKNSNQLQLPLFVREGAIVPMLLDSPQTLCDPNYVNNPNIATMDSGLHFLIYPADDSTFTVYDGTNVRCQTTGAIKTITLSSIGRAIRLQVLGKEPNSVLHDAGTLQKLTTRAAFDAANTGWWQDTANNFTFVKFPHPGGETVVTF
jgi:alpha-D-xyloside xylohydrolase